MLPSCCWRCVLNWSRFHCVGKILKSFPSQIRVFIQGKLWSISELLCSAVYDLSFISKINRTALSCLFFVISVRCCCVEFPPRYRSCLLAQGNMLRLVLCLVRTELKLRRFCKPTFMVFKSGACCKYVTSIHEYHKLSQARIYLLELSV